MLVCIYFISPDYLVIHRSIGATLLFPTYTILAGPKFYRYIKFIVRVVGYFSYGIYVIPCHHTVAVLDVTNHFVVTAFPILDSELLIFIIKILLPPTV